MTHRFHSIIKPRTDGSFVGWVEEMPGGDHARPFARRMS